MQQRPLLRLDRLDAVDRLLPLLWRGPAEPAQGVPHRPQQVPVPVPMHTANGGHRKFNIELVIKLRCYIISSNVDELEN